MPNGILDGKIALITGGGRGLGREMAIGFAAAGAAGVAITAAPASDENTDLIEDELSNTLAAIEAAGGKGIALLGNVSNEDDCRRVVAKTVAAFGGLQILVNNAGMAGRYAHGGKGSLQLYELDPKGLREVVETNVLGVYLMGWAASQHLIDTGWGRIINISKRVDSMHRKALTPYGPSKAALEATTISWAESLFDSGVTVNALSPGGLVNTKFSWGDVRARGLDPTVITPMAVWLASPASVGITGCRFAAEFWDESLSPNDAAERCRERAIFPKPAHDTPLKKAWQATSR
ncbi:SDR family oxidoreductase [Alphaproteobacteria bacterium]|nr:SDR family oxidoreductase [Alphaproteobacteria bacterium]